MSNHISQCVFIGCDSDIDAPSNDPIYLSPTSTSSAPWEDSTIQFGEASINYNVTDGMLTSNEYSDDKPAVYCTGNGVYWIRFSNFRSGYDKIQVKINTIFSNGGAQIEYAGYSSKELYSEYGSLLCSNASWLNKTSLIGPYFEYSGIKRYDLYWLKLTVTNYDSDSSKISVNSTLTRTGTW